MPLSIFYGAVGSDEERFEVLDTAHKNGATHWDTADIYGDSEDLLGKWFKRTGKRKEIFIATKFGIDVSVGIPPGIRGDREYVKQQINKSLERLGVDSIDLVYCHRIDPKTPIEVTVGAMAEFVKEGKVKYLGLSECTAKDLRRAHAVHPISAIQLEISPFALDIFDPKTKLLETARELGVTLVAYSPLGRGLLTGQIKSAADFGEDDFRNTIPKYSAENFPKILGLVSRIREVGARHNVTPSQITLAWILAQGHDFVVIPGTKKIKYVEENAGAAKVQLTSEDVDVIRKIAEEADIPGERYSGAFLDQVQVESPALQNV
ncbi:Aldo/keto reductase [Tricholoma matsutake]|nr:Aldo/keto reductase [Tricholoma matsutake 945]